MKKRCLFVVLVLIANSGLASAYTGKVIGVTDGDTIGVLIDLIEHKIRLAEIDTPEKAQPYGKKAKQALSDLVFGKIVDIEKKDVDRYGRIVGRIYINDVDVNAEMVRGGHAWVYRQYATDQGLYAMENDAKQNKRGLWALPEAQQVPPWQWRSSRFTVAATGKSKPQKKANSEFKCEGKTKCGQMRSCEEARFYLTQCGVRRLDRDKDGIPCEKICG